MTLPVCLPAVLDISIYLFANAMTTASAVVFLYSPDTALASIAVLKIDDAGDIAAAAAMDMMIFFTTRSRARSTSRSAVASCAGRRPGASA